MCLRDKQLYLYKEEEASSGGLSSVVPNSTPPCFVNSQLVSLPPVGILNLLCLICIICLLRPFDHSGAPAARRAAKRSPIIIEKGTTRMHRNRNPCNSFLKVKMASGMDHGCVRPTTTTTNDVAQHGGHPAKYQVMH